MILQRTAQVTLSDQALEVLVAPGVFFAFEHGQETPFGAIGWRRRQRHSEQRIQIGQAGTGQLEPDVERSQTFGSGHGAFHGNTRLAETDLTLERERFAAFLQRQQSTHLSAAGDLGIIEGAGRFPVHSVAALGVGIQAVESRAHVELAHLVGHLHVNTPQGDALKVDGPAWTVILACLLALIHPVCVALGITLQGNAAVADLQAWNLDMAAEQRQGIDVQRQALDMRHALFATLEAFRVPGDDIVHRNVRPRHPAVAPLPIDIEIALDRDGTLHGLGCFLFHEGPQTIPVEHGHDDDEKKHQANQPRHHPQGNSRCSPHL